MDEVLMIYAQTSSALITRSCSTHSDKIWVFSQYFQENPLDKN